jgi:hypothetical protein
MEMTKTGWGKTRTTYDFKCVCGHTIIKDERKAKERMERLHLTKCEAGRTAVASGNVVDYWNDVFSSAKGGLKLIAGDSTRGGRVFNPSESILNNIK